MLTRMLQRRGTTAQWNDVQSTLILSTGEIGLIVEPGNPLDGKFKIGNGVDTWADLSFYNNDDQNAQIYAKLVANQTFQGSQIITPTQSYLVPLVVSGLASQSADLQRWRDSSNNTIASIDATGKITAVGGLFNSTVNVNSNKITNVATPTDSGDATNKQYVDDAIAGLAWKTPVNLVAASGLNTFINVPLSGSGATVVLDGHTALTSTHNGYRLLLLAQTTSSENGIYVYNQTNGTYTLTRAVDSDTFTELKGASVFVQEGTNYGTSSWVQTNHYLTSFSGQNWVQFNGASQITAGSGLTKTGNTINAIGTADRITANADSIDIASTYAGQTSITTLGTIGTGTWNASTIAVNKGGTNITSYTVGDLLYASGTTQLSKLAAANANYVLLSGGAGTAPSWGQVVTDSLANSSSTGNGVTYAKMQYVSGQYKILGRISSGSGIVEELSADNLITMLNTASSGKVDTARLNTLSGGNYGTSTSVAKADHTHTIDDLSDVVITGTPQDRQVIKYKGSPVNAWVNEVPSGGISVGSTPPSTPASGDAWMDSNDGSLYVYYNDDTKRPAGTNLITNPNFETNTTGWSGTNATIARDPAYEFVGLNSLKVTPSTNTGRASFTATTVNGTMYRFSAYVYTTINKNLRVSVTSPAINGTTTAVVYNNWTRLDVSFTANGTSTTVNVESIDSLDPFYVDAVMLEASTTLNDYFDGSSYNSTWTGTANASTSTTAGGTSSQWVQVRANSALEATILTRMSAVESRATNLEASNPVVVGSVAARSALFPAPVQGNTVFRTDLGYMERYYTAYDAVNNPSGTTGTVGWYEYRATAPLSENYIINGALDFWQRGTSFTAPNQYTADRWFAQNSVATNISRQVYGATALGVSYYLQATTTNATNSMFLTQAFEDLDVAKMKGKTVTLSFYASASTSLSLTARIDKSATANTASTGFSVISSNTVTVTTGIQRFFVTALIPNDSTANGVRVAFATTNIANAASVNIFGIQLEDGPVATDFRRNQSNPQAELAVCQRYYEKSYSLSVTPGTSDPAGAYTHYGSSDGSSNIVVPIRFAVTKRTASYTPTFYTYQGTAGSMNFGRNGFDGTGTATLYRANETMMHAYVNVGFSWISCNASLQWTCSAEL